MKRLPKDDALLYSRAKAAGKLWAQTACSDEAFARIRAGMKLDNASDEASIRNYLTASQIHPDRAWIRFAWLADVPYEGRTEDDCFLSEQESYLPADDGIYSLAVSFWRDAIGDVVHIPQGFGSYDWIADEAVVQFACGAIEQWNHAHG